MFRFAFLAGGIPQTSGYQLVTRAPSNLHPPPCILVSSRLEVRDGDDLFQVAKWHVQKSGLTRGAEVIEAFLAQVSRVV